MARPPRRTPPAPPAAPATGGTAPAQPTIGDVVEGLRTGALTLDGDAKAQYDAGYVNGVNDYTADNSSTFDGASFDEGDSVYVQAGYKIGIDTARNQAEDTKRASNLGGKGDHDKNGGVGGNVTANPEYDQGYADGLLYTGEFDDNTAGITGKSDQYRMGFQQGAVKARTERDAAGGGAAVDIEGEQEDIVTNSLDYDNGYHAGWKFAETGVQQRETTVQYNADFDKGYSDGYGDKKQNKEFAKNVRDLSELANANAEHAAEGLDMEARMRRVEQTLGLVSPKQA